MTSIALQISSNIISAHMMNSIYKHKKFKGYNIALYNEKKEYLSGDKIKNNIDFTQSFYSLDDNYILIDQSSRMHLGVKYIVILKDSIQKEINTLLKIILFIAISVLIIISIVGYILSKIFLRPIQRERAKLDRFIKDSTHELNTPITSMLLSVGGLQGGDVVTKKILNRIKISSERVYQIYSNLSYLLILDSINTDKNKSLDLKDIIIQEIELFEEYANSKNVIIKSDLSSLVINIDKESAKRLISNLLSNAIKYNKRGGSVNIELLSNKMVISDSGIGISKESIDKIYDRFYRDNNYAGGFGIGMDIVKRICDNYGIEIEIKSELNKGTIITLLPLSKI